VFYIAAVFLQVTADSKHPLTADDVYTGCYVVFVGAIGSGVSLSGMPSVSKAKACAKKVFGIIEEKSEINPQQPGH
jgi:hypothetical protein